jgi:hypothetical protein
MGFLFLKLFCGDHRAAPAVLQAMSVEPEPPNGSNDIPLKMLGLYFI